MCCCTTGGDVVMPCMFNLHRIGEQKRLLKQLKTNTAFHTVGPLMDPERAQRPHVSSTRVRQVERNCVLDAENFFSRLNANFVFRLILSCFFVTEWPSPWCTGWEPWAVTKTLTCTEAERRWSRDSPRRAAATPSLCTGPAGPSHRLCDPS